MAVSAVVCASFILIGTIKFPFLAFRKLLLQQELIGLPSKLELILPAFLISHKVRLENKDHTIMAAIVTNVIFQNVVLIFAIGSTADLVFWFVGEDGSLWLCWLLGSSLAFVARARLSISFGSSPPDADSISSLSLVFEWVGAILFDLSAF